MAYRDKDSNCFGLVRAYGRVIVHEDSAIRAEGMDIIAIVVVRYLDDELNDWEAYGWGFQQPKHVTILSETVERAAALLGVTGTVVERAVQAETWLGIQEALYRATYPVEDDDWEA